MKTSVFLLLVLLTGGYAMSQSGAVEHYYYLTKANVPLSVPIINYTSSKNWYGELRYNYEEFNTISIYGGKTFYSSGDWSCKVTPLLGCIIGTMNGGALGANIGMEYGSVFLSAQSQYAYSFNNKLDNYFFNWSEIGYSVKPWLYGGFALQQTSAYRGTEVWEPGCIVGVSIKNWTIPIYLFNPFAQNAFFILGINWEWQTTQKINRPIL